MVYVQQGLQLCPAEEGDAQVTTLQILRGVPGSGKSTHALSLEGFTRVNRDDIRMAMYGKYYGPPVNEEAVTQVEDAMIEAALAAGEDTVVDATNLNRKALKTKLSLASRYGATVEYVDFPISLEEALNRDANREKQVGPKVISMFFSRYKIKPELGILPAPPEPLPVFKKYTPDTSLPPAYIIDTDGTVANPGTRNPYNTKLYHEDTVHEHVATLVRHLFDGGEVSVVAVSGRSDEFREVTQTWWNDNNLWFDEFHMRKAEDKSMDAIVKHDIFHEHIAPRYNVLGAIDDRPQVLRMWQTIGVPTFAVGDGKEF